MYDPSDQDQQSDIERGLPMTTCPVDGCARSPHPNHAICNHHADQLERDLGDLPALAGELVTTLTRQTATGGRNGGRGSERPLPYDQGASEALDVLRGTLEAWGREIGVRGTPAALLAGLDALLAHPDAGQAVEEIAAARRNALRAVDHHRELLYAGTCDVGGCTAQIYAQPDRATVRCRACGTDHDIQERQHHMLDALHARLCTIREIVRLAAWSGEFPDSKRTDDLLRQWAHRGKLTAAGLDLHGRETYPFGTVIEELRKSARKCA